MAKRTRSARARQALPPQTQQTLSTLQALYQLHVRHGQYHARTCGSEPPAWVTDQAGKIAATIKRIER